MVFDQGRFEYEENVLSERSESNGQKCFVYLFCISLSTNIGDMFYLYILRSKFNKLYIGQTNSIPNRQNLHKWGVAAKFTAQNPGPYSLVHVEEFLTRTEAMHREKQLKKWSRAKKEALITNDLNLLKRL